MKFQANRFGIIIVTIGGILLAAGARHVWQIELDQRMCMAAWGGNLSDVQQLIETGADPNASGPGGGHVLERTLENAKFDVVEFLIAHGSNVQTLDEHHINLLLKAPECPRIRADLVGKGKIPDWICKEPYKSRPYPWNPH